MAVFSILPNRGARFGHQFFELSMIRALSLKHEGYLVLKNSLEANSRRFGEIFNPSDQLFDDWESFMQVDLDEFDCAETFSESLSENTLSLTRKDVVFHGSLQKSPWLSPWLRQVLTQDDLIRGLECTALDARLKFVKKQRIPINPCRRIAVHIRRGDVSNQKNASRYVAADYYLSAIDALVCRGVSPEIFDIYSTPDLELDAFSCFKGLSFKTTLDEVDAFCSLASAAFIIGSPSGFCYTAHLLSSSPILIHPLDWNIYYKQTAFRNFSDFSACVINRYSLNNGV